MKIALLFPNNLFTSPYLKYYYDILNNENAEYDLIIWNRQNILEENCIAFVSKNRNESNFSKIKNFLDFRRFVIANLKRRNYEKVIVFSGQLGIILSTFLLKNYKKRYILDIRDYSRPMGIFENRFKRLIKGAYFVGISSNGFKDWLPESNNYVISHNLDINLIEYRLNNYPARSLFFGKNIIQVDTIGQIKDFSADTKFINQLKQDKRFSMNFIGFGNTLNLLIKHCKKENISNVSFHGPYKKEEEAKLLKDTDLINILISLEEFNKGTSLLSNRLYLSALQNIPCIVNNNTEQSRIVVKYNLGIIVDKYEDLPTQIMDYVKNFNPETYTAGCLNFLIDVKKDYEIFEKNINKFLQEK